MRSRVALLAAPLLLLALLPGSVAAAPGHDAAAERARVFAYWTPARMAAAVPRDFTFDAVRGFRPMARPGSGNGTVTGASWTGGGAVLKASGRVYFEMGGGAWICSGSVLSDSRNDYSLVLTAGHCVVDADTGEFAHNWLFIPSFDTSPTYTCANTTYGCWTATALVARSEFANAGGFNDTAVTHDFAVAVVGGGGKQASSNLQLDATVGGSFPISYSSVANGTTLGAYGYPAAGKYHGKDLTYCLGPVGRDPGTSNLTYSLACDMTGGSSGGPWLNGDARSFSAVLTSLNSYGCSGVKNMYGPIFNSDTQAVVTTANGATSGNIEVGP